MQEYIFSKKPLTESLSPQSSSSMVPITALIGRTMSRILGIVPLHIENSHLKYEYIYR